MSSSQDRFLPLRSLIVFLLLAGVFVAGWWTWIRFHRLTDAAPPPAFQYEPRQDSDANGFAAAAMFVKSLPADASLEDIRSAWLGADDRWLSRIEQELSRPGRPLAERVSVLINKSSAQSFRGDPRSAYQTLALARQQLAGQSELTYRFLPTIMFLQGVTGLRRGETENCIACRGESSCILPIAAGAVHINPAGSRLAIQHFNEYLKLFPSDLQARWLLNLAHMTLGEYPEKVDARHRLSLEHYEKPEGTIGRFRDIGRQVGLDRFNRAGGAIMDDFDNDGRLDIAVTTFDQTAPMALYHNNGEGAFEDWTERAGLNGQYGGLNCVQTDFNNDGWLDLFVIRGAWIPEPLRPSLLRNNQDGTFTDVTCEARLDAPMNSIAASWADFDNDGWLDLFVCGERQASRLYRNRRDGTFDEVGQTAGVDGAGRVGCKGAAWIDFDNDGWQDLFLTYLNRHDEAVLYHNERNGSFRNVTSEMNIAGPQQGFSCWAFDYDNDGWLDLFATCYEKSTADAVRGLINQPHKKPISRLYRNQQGQRFEDVTRAAGLDQVYLTMGSNFADFDNDGFLDLYLSTGDPAFSTLVPNRMFRNVGGKRFADVTAPSGTGNLQKGHGVALGDWDRDGNIDLFLEMGGAVEGDRYHNILFQNPGQHRHWLRLKLVGTQSNRAAIGARLRIVTAGEQPLTIHRHISSGSSFGANPLQQTIGLADATRIATLEIHWPTSGITQTFSDLEVDQSLEITEASDQLRRLDWPAIPLSLD